MHGMQAMYDPILVAGWSRTLLFIIVAPVTGLIIAELLMENKPRRRKAGFQRNDQKRLSGICN